MSIYGTDFDRALAPPDMRIGKDSTESYGCATDVTSLPGMFCNVSAAEDIKDDAQRMTELSATLLSLAMGRSTSIHNTLWKTKKRHGMSQVKHCEALFKLVKNVGKAAKPAFEQQTAALNTFMLSRHYSEREIERYTNKGLLVHIVGDSFTWYQSLLNHVQQLAFDHSQYWEKGPAKAMMDFHSEKQYQIRMFSINRK